MNFYIDELYGNPTHAENRNAYNTTLGVFVSKLPMSELKLFNHPVVIYVTDLKWKQFGRTQFLKCGIPSLPPPPPPPPSRSWGSRSAPKELSPPNPTAAAAA